jgi:hypothetical protein
MCRFSCCEILIVDSGFVFVLYFILFESDTLLFSYRSLVSRLIFLDPNAQFKKIKGLDNYWGWGGGEGVNHLNSNSK